LYVLANIILSLDHKPTTQNWPEYC